MSTSESIQPVVPILLYHRIVRGPGDADPFAVPVANFAEHLRAVVASGRRPLTVSGYVAARRQAGPQAVADAVLVTFDDGCRDFAELAVPQLVRFGIPATMYVVAGLVGASSRWTTPDVPLMGWSELHDLDHVGVDIELGAHSMTHRQLDLLGAAASRHQIAESKRVLEDGLQRPVPSFAYPFGHHHRRNRSEVVAAGFESACAVKNRLSPLGDDVFALARVTIQATDRTEHVVELLHGRGAPVAGPNERLLTTGYRWYRRARSIAKGSA